MASSPSHRFGQLIGDLLEEIMLPLLQNFCDRYNLYLDKKGPRSARKGKKLSWADKFDNLHDLDFVIEKGGTDSIQGRPIAFVETAWRRYTKHSRNKTQEIMGAVLPIAEKYDWDAPFLGVVLAGLFTQPSVNQMKSSGFEVALFSYQSIVSSFASVEIDVAFDEQTSDESFQNIVEMIMALTPEQRSEVKNKLVEYNESEMNLFLENLRYSIERQVEELLLIPLYGKEYKFKNINDLKEFIESYAEDCLDLSLVTYKVFVRFTNNSSINSEFMTKTEVLRFLQYING